MTEDELNKEIKTTDAIVRVSQTIINNSKLLLEADKHFNKQSKIIQNVLAVEGDKDVIQ